MNHDIRLVIADDHEIFRDGLALMLSRQPNIALALHNAKKQWLQDDKENAMLQLPYYWAGFVYSGHLQKLAVPVIESNKKYYWLFTLLILPAVFYVVMRKKKNA